MFHSPQQLVLHVMLLVEYDDELQQVFPPQLGAGAIQERPLYLVPPPHVLEQVDQEPHCAQRPSTAEVEGLI